MANVMVTEAPGGLGEAYQCTYCGRMYLAHGLTDDGSVDMTLDVDPPKACQRCGAPMDYEAALKYADEQAEKQASPALRTVRRFRKV